MKIGIITLNGENFGNRLQNYAVQEILKEYGEVYTVKQEKKVLNNSNIKKRRFSPKYIKAVIDSRLQNIYHISTRKKSTLKKIVYYLKSKNSLNSALQLRSSAYKDFDKKYINFEPNLLHLKGDEQSSWVKTYNAWVCGSDQIWNPSYPTATRNAFLQFTKSTRRVSFSASIGINDIKKLPESYKEWIEEIPYLSVRENKAAELVKELTGREAEVLLDPTMLLPRDRWEAISNAVDYKFPKKFALTYFLGNREIEYENFINEDIKARNIERIDLLNGEFPEYLSFGPVHMVAAIRQADIIYTDSFHGVVFSILFHKPFIVFKRIEEGASMFSRLDTLLSLFDLKDRIYSGDNCKLSDNINFVNVDQVIKREQVRAKAFLDNAFHKIKESETEEIPELHHIHINRKEHCFGCTACANVCPKNCITMRSDTEGFLYPEVDEAQCIGCSKCIKVCPFNNINSNGIGQIYAAINKDSKIRQSSSSGGVFYQLCKYILDKKGIVYGVAWSNDMVALHRRITELSDVRYIQGSKYVQSKLSDTFKLVKDDLLTGCEVLFSGTPCQVAGLKNYLGKKFDNLLLVDVLCHGVPSPLLLKEYISSMETKYGSKVIGLNMRDKKKSWHRLFSNMQFSNSKVYYKFCGYDPYLHLFLNNKSLRPSCFECKFTSKDRQGDVTLGDFWGIGKRHYDFDDNKGTSLVAINTERGHDIWAAINNNFIILESNFDEAKEGNKVLLYPSIKNKDRDKFFSELEYEGYNKAIAKYCDIPSKPKQIYYDCMRLCLDIVRKICHKKY